jgi:hypothetical protein
MPIPTLFEDFVGTTGLSDFPGAVHRRRASYAFPTRSAAPSARDSDLPFPRMVYPSMHRVSDRAGAGYLALATHPVWPSASPYSVGTSAEVCFAAQYPARPFPYRRFDSVLTDYAARLGARTPDRTGPKQACAGRETARPAAIRPARMRAASVR